MAPGFAWIGHRAIGARTAIVAVACATASAYAIAGFTRVEWPSILLQWVFLVPWLVALDRTRSMRGTFAAGLLMSVAFVTIVFSWFPEMIADYTGGSWWTGLAVVIVLAPLIEPQLVTFALARHLAQPVPGGGRRWRTALIGAGVYVGTEWAWPKLLADTIGHGVYASARLRQAADLIGAHGLTFVLILGNECVLEAPRDVRRQPRARAHGRCASQRPPRASSCSSAASPPTAASASPSSRELRPGTRSRSRSSRATSRTTTG